MTGIAHTNPLSAASCDGILLSIQSFLGKIGLAQYDRTASLWIFFAGCGIAELCISFLICTPLERFWPLTTWTRRNSIAADVTYAFFVRVVLFPLIAFFEYDWLHRSLDGVLGAYAITVQTLTGLIPILNSWPLLVFIVNFAILDLADYLRHRLSHRIGWWYGISLSRCKISEFSDLARSQLWGTITHLSIDGPRPLHLTR